MQAHCIALLLLLAAGAAARLALYRGDVVLWDGAVYVQMGQFLWSRGEVGLWEGMRPPLWPALLGAIWKLGLPVPETAQLVSALCSLLTVPVLWDLSRRVAGFRTAWFAAILWSLSPILFYWGAFRFTEIPALLWMVLSFHQMERGRAFTAGLCLSLATLTRFPVGLVFFAMLPLLLHDGRRERWLRFGAGAAIPVAAYAAVLAAQGPTLFEPLFAASRALAREGALSGQSPLFYLDFLWRRESFLLALAPVGWWLLARRRASTMAWTLTLSGVLFLLLFSLLRVPLVRYILPALPGLYFAAALALGALCDRTGRRWRPALTAFLIALAVGLQLPSYQRIRFPEPQRDLFQSYVEQFQEQLEGQRIWISSPIMLLGSGLRANRLLYYPVVDETSMRDAVDELGEADVVLIARDHLPCSPPEDPDCVRERRRLFESLQSEFIAEWEGFDGDGAVEVGIYRRVSR